MGYLLITQDTNDEVITDHNFDFQNEPQENVIVQSDIISTQQTQAMNEIEWGITRSGRNWRNKIS